MNDHRVFFPYIGLVIATVKALQVLFTSMRQLNSINKNILFTLSVFFLIPYSYGTYQRNIVWKTEESLWKDVTIKSPKNGRGHMNYGLTQMGKRNYEEALKEFTTTLELWPYYSYAHINMGILKDAMGKRNEAEPYFQNAIKLGPNLPECYFYYAKFLAKTGRSNLAIDNLNKALELAPAHINSRYLLMEILLKDSRFDELKNISQKTLVILPGDKITLGYLEASETKGTELEHLLKKVNTYPTAEAYIELSLIYYNKEDYINCISACNQALALKPNYAAAYNNICSAFNQLKEWDKAIDACNMAMKIDPNDPLAKNNLAWAQVNKQMLVK